jgi:hypothetical protein
MPPEPDRLLSTARPWVAAVAALSAAVLAWAALVLPWRMQAPLGSLLWALAALHLSTLAAALWRPERLARALVLLGLGSCAAALVLGVSIGVTAIEMVQTFGRLGWAIAVALLAIGWLALLATLPAAVVGVYCLRLGAPRARHGRT